MKVKDEFLQKVIDCGRWYTVRFAYESVRLVDPMGRIDDVFIVQRMPIVKGCTDSAKREIIGAFDVCGKRI